MLSPNIPKQRLGCGLSWNKYKLVQYSKHTFQTKPRDFKFINTYPAAHMPTPRGHWTAWMTPIEFFPSVTVSIVLSTRAVWTGAWMRVTGLVTLWRPRTAPWPVPATVRHPSWTRMTPTKYKNLQQSKPCDIKILINDKNTKSPH